MAALENLVLFETNTASARGRQALQFGFEREGIEFAACEQPSALVALCIKQSPQLVVISLPDGEKAIAETLAALDELRATESIAKTPVLVLGERDLRDEVLRAGADEFMPRPAYLRDVITLAKMVVGLRARDDRELRGLVEEYGLFFLLRALSVVGRSAIIELERVGRYAELHIVAGEVAMARIGRMAGQHAFQHLLLWHDARLRLRLESPSAERKIFVPTLRLLEDASRFAQKFEETASKVGGSRVIFRRVVSRAAEVRATIPAEIETFSHLCDGRRTLVDIVEESTFRPLDVIKIVHRLERLGAIERVAVARQPAGEASVYNWLRGNEHPDYPQDHRSTVTEAGRRAAEAHAEEHARRAEDRAPSDDVLPQSSLLQRLGEAGAQQADRRANPQSGKHGKKNKHKQQQQQQQPAPSSARATNPATPAAKAAAAASTPNGNGHSKPAPSEPAREIEDQETRPFFKPATDEPVAAKLSPAAHKALPTKEPVFDEVEDAFFAQEAELAKVDPVESFDDLDAGLPKKPAARWSFMSLFRPTPTTNTTKRPAASSPPASSGSSSSSTSGANKAPSSKTGKKR